MRRREIPEALRDLAAWPGVDTSALSEELRARYQARALAVRRYIEGASLTSIESETGLPRGTISWMVKRCVSPHADGRIHGFRALIPHIRVKPYRRVKSPRRTSQQGSRGLAGALGQLLERYPAIRAPLERRIRIGKLYLSETGRLIGLGEANGIFLEACRAQGIAASEYPLNQLEGAYRSLARTLRAWLIEHASWHRYALGEPAVPAAERPFGVVELDGHKVDLRLRVRYSEPSGFVRDVEIERLYLLALIDVCTRAILGWHLVLAPEYNRYDVILAIQDALTPRRKRREFLIPGLSYGETAGFVTEVCPQAAYACWESLRFDNAKAHLSEDALRTLTEIVGCRIDVGPVKQPKQRPHIERFFGTLTRVLSHRLPGSTGSGPQDGTRRRKKHDQDPERFVSVEELEELLEVSIANYNGTGHDGLNGRTPLEAMRYFVDERQTLFRTLPRDVRTRLHLLQPAHLATVRGNPAKSIAPYVSLFGARYSNEVLARTARLIGTEIRVFLNPGDMREAYAYLPNGGELGRLGVLGGWRYTRHSLRLRQEILKLRRVGKLRFSEHEDPVASYAKYQRPRVRKSRKEATRMVEVVSALEKPEPTPARPARQGSDRPAQPLDLPIKDVQSF